MKNLYFPILIEISKFTSPLRTVGVLNPEFEDKDLDVLTREIVIRMAQETDFRSEYIYETTYEFVVGVKTKIIVWYQPDKPETTVTVTFVKEKTNV